VNPGEVVSPGAPLLRLVDLRRLRIEAEIDEYDIPRCKPDCSATITAPGHSDKSWQGTVTEIADCLIPRRIRPEDPGRLADTRVLPVRITLPQDCPLKLGQRVEVKIAEATVADSHETRSKVARSESGSTRSK
jgi:hypothetical protein